MNVFMRSLDIHNYILMGFYINECFYEKFGHLEYNCVCPKLLIKKVINIESH